METVNYCTYTSYEVAVMSGYQGNPSDWMNCKKADNLIDADPFSIQHIRRLLMDTVFCSTEFHNRLVSMIDAEFSIIKYEYNVENRLYNFKIKKTVAKKKKGYEPTVLFFRQVLANILSIILTKYIGEINNILDHDATVRSLYTTNGMGNFASFIGKTTSKIILPEVCQSLFDVYVVGENTFTLRI